MEKNEREVGKISVGLQATIIFGWKKVGCFPTPVECLMKVHPDVHDITITALVTKRYQLNKVETKRKRWQGKEQEGRKLGVEAKISAIPCLFW
jgi:hypothetical protein